jgi:hypothetical protein
MSKSDTLENAILALIFNNTAIPGIGDAGGLQPSATAGTLYVALHTGDPTDAGTQASSECTYTSYARVAVARSGAGWTVTGSQAVNAAEVLFPEATGGTETATHFSVGEDATGAGDILYHAPLTASLAIATGIRPRFAAGTLQFNEG